MWKNKKGANGLGIAVVLLMAIVVIGGALVLFGIIPIATQKAVSTTTTSEIKTAVSSGDISQLKIYVYDRANNDQSTKVAMQVYCLDQKGNMVIDGDTSSTTTALTGTANKGDKLTCYAFNATYMAKEGKSIDVTEDSTPISLDTYKAFGAGQAKIQFYTNTYATGTAGVINVTIDSANTQATLKSMRFEVNGSQMYYPLGGFYFDTVVTSNVSTIDLGGSAVLTGADHASTQLVSSNLASKVSARKEKWNIVYEVDDKSSEAGNQPVWLKSGNVLETGTVTITDNGNTCNQASDLISSYAFAKGFFKSALTNGGIKFGHETDAVTPSAILSDITGDNFYCN